MNCAWCGRKDDDSNSHGICVQCETKYFPPKENTKDREDKEKCQNIQSASPKE